MLCRRVRNLGYSVGAELASPQSANYEQVESAEASGDRLNITTKAPSPTLLDQLVNLSIVPEDYVEKVGDERFNLEPVGSGAYRLDDWNKGTDVVLRANAEYWDGRPQISSVGFRAVPNGATRVADLQSGEAQVATAMTPDDLKTIEGSGNLKALSEPSERVAYMTLNHLADTPTQDKKVRQAIAHAVDKEEVISSLLEGYARPVSVPLTPASFGYTDEVGGYDYDPDRSRRLLEEAGHGDGLKLSMPTTPAYDQRIVEALQADLQEVGIELDVRTYDLATYLQRVQDPERKWGSVGFAQWSCSCLDADGTIYPVFHTGSIRSSYSDEEFDRFVEEARTTFDEAERERLYREAFRVLDEDAAAVPLWQVYALYGVSGDLRWQPDAQESFFVRDMKLAG